MTDVIQIQTENPSVDINAMSRPEDYVMEDNDLRAATNAALTLGKPLLLTGDAGVGKSQFANWLAYQLGLGSYLKFVVKSTTEARDLFYHYDALARFHSAQITHTRPRDPNGSKSSGTDADDIDPLRYIAYNALGTAILCSMGRTEAVKQGFVSEVMGDFLKKIPQTPVRSVVLVDEIDKAPRDVPNDILDEVDNLSFTVRELGNLTAETHSRMRPMVVITSNSERDLPKPFLRRCVYYHMGFPSDEALATIVEKRIGKRFQVGDGLLSQGIRLFRYLRENAGLRQPPGLAELLDWLYSLAVDYSPADPDLQQQPQLFATIKSTLLKDRHDQELFDKDREFWVDQALGLPKGGKDPSPDG